MSVIPVGPHLPLVGYTYSAPGGAQLHVSAVYRGSDGLYRVRFKRTGIESPPMPVNEWWATSVANRNIPPTAPPPPKAGAWYEFSNDGTEAGDTWYVLRVLSDGNVCATMSMDAIRTEVFCAWEWAAHLPKLVDLSKSDTLDLDTIGVPLATVGPGCSFDTHGISIDPVIVEALQAGHDVLKEMTLSVQGARNVTHHICAYCGEQGTCLDDCARDFALVRLDQALGMVSGKTNDATQLAALIEEVRAETEDEPDHTVSRTWLCDTASGMTLVVWHEVDSTWHPHTWANQAHAGLYSTTANLGTLDNPRNWRPVLVKERAMVENCTIEDNAGVGIASTDDCWASATADHHQRRLAELEKENAELRERLQFDPGGSDKIDEQEECIAQLRHRVEIAEHYQKEAEDALLRQDHGHPFDLMKARFDTERRRREIADGHVGSMHAALEIAKDALHGRAYHMNETGYPHCIWCGAREAVGGIHAKHCGWQHTMYSIDAALSARSTNKPPPVPPKESAVSGVDTIQESGR